MHFEEINDWLGNYYPDLELKRLSNGAYGVYQRIYRWTVHEFYNEDLEEFKLDAIPVDDAGNPVISIAFPEVGYSCIFATRNQVLGSWVCDEVQRRDPRLSYREGNHFHQAFLASYAAEAQREKDAAHAREGTSRAWEAVKKNDALMNRIGRHMSRGRMDLAVNELSPEAMLRNAYRENPKEVRSKDYWRSIARG